MVIAMNFIKIVVGILGMLISIVIIFYTVMKKKLTQASDAAIEENIESKAFQYNTTDLSIDNSSDTILLEDDGSNDTTILS